MNGSQIIFQEKMRFPDVIKGKNEARKRNQMSGGVGGFFYDTHAMGEGFNYRWQIPCCMIG